VRVLIRADGTSAMGTGHVMRMIALADKIRGAGGEACLAAAALDEALERRAGSHGIEVVRGDFVPGSGEDGRWVAKLAAEREIGWVAADGYAFGERFQEAARERGARLLLADDYGHSARYTAEIVLNQNLSADERVYVNRAAQTRLLLGPRYALIRSEFLVRRPDPPPVAECARRILVTMGGADPDNATEKILDALGRVTDPELLARVVIGPSNPNAELLARGTDDPRIELVPARDAMVELMLWADLAVAGAGITTHELCFMGVPSMLVVLADNQLEVSRTLDHEGAGENLGWHYELDVADVAGRIAELCSSPERRREMIARGRGMVDGLGSARVLEAMCP
jgi:UDP-2,4-diacetamido-2,4,6-trideoxy-beta-L-altropyranose hydrolase